MKHLLLFFLLCYAPVAAQVAATSPHQPKSTTLTTLSGFTWPANAPGVLTNNGTNTLTYTGTTTGGMAGDDDGKLPLYYNSGWLMANKLIAASTGNTSPAIEYGPTSIGFVESSGTFIGELQWSTITTNRTITLPNATGTVVTTGNLSAITTTGTITSGTWQGTDIALGYIAQGGATDGQAMVWNNGTGTWAPGTVSGGGLTINSTAITGGTSTALLYDNGGTVGKLNIFLEGAAVLQMGADINGAPTTQTIKAHDGITGTNVSGATLTLSSGNSTGTGTSAVQIATPAAGSSGATARTAATRVTISNTGLQIQATTAPTSIPPAGAFILYVDPSDNTLRARGSSGTITILAIP